MIQKARSVKFNLRTEDVCQEGLVDAETHINIPGLIEASSILCPKIFIQNFFPKLFHIQKYLRARINKS